MKLTASPRALAAALALGLVPAAQASLDVAGIDRSLDACTDFYAFANKSWLQSTTIPADRARWGTFEIIDQRNEKVLLEAIENERKRPITEKRYKRGSPEWMAVEYYVSGMNRNRIAYHGFRTLRPLLDAAGAVSTPEDIARTLGQLHAKGIGAGFAFSVDADRKRSTHYLLGLFQGGLGMPDRDYYFLEDERSKKLREGYLKHVARMFELIEVKPDDAARDAQAVFALETELARASMTNTERRDDTKTYNKMTVAELSAAAPGFPWATYLEAAGAKNVTELNAAQPEFLKALARLASERPEAWRTYLRWHIVRASATKLPEAFEEESFDFYQRQFRGVQTPPPRHRRVLQTIGGPYGSEGLGFALGKIFVDEAFPPEAKARALELINNVKAALADRLKAATWMTEETRKASLEKLNTMQVKIGYPEKWRDMSNAKVGAQLFIENWIAANEFDHKREVARIGQPVDKTEWLISPHIVNAYYYQNGNEIVFPAAILQPPYFDAKADDAVNYGGIGMVIGHEITHGFDDRGRRFDKDGNLRDWWTAEDEKRYNERAQLIERQYAAMDAVEGVSPNGKLTLGENISDVGGLKIAYDALQKALKGKPRKTIDGLTPEQRFFLSFAQGWRSNARLEWERNSLLTGQHSLPRYRVRGPLAHMPEFARAFKCDASKTLLPNLSGMAIW